MKWISRIKRIFPHRICVSALGDFIVLRFCLCFYWSSHHTCVESSLHACIIQANNNCLFVVRSTTYTTIQIDLTKKPICPSNLWLGQCLAASKVQRFYRDIDVFDRITSMLTRFVHYECAVFTTFSDYQPAAHIVHASDESVKPIALICARCSCSAIMVAHLCDFLFSLV